MKRNIKESIIPSVEFYRYYLLYCFSYFLLYLHSYKKKVITLVGAIKNIDPDLVLYIIGAVFFLSFLLHTRWNKWKEFSLKGFYLLIGFILIGYSQWDCQLVHSFIYIWESVFFCFCGMLGILLPLLFWNQLFFLIALLAVVCIGKIGAYMQFYGILGYLSLLSYRQWAFWFFSLSLYILTTVILDLLKITSCNSYNQVVSDKSSNFSNFLDENRSSKPRLVENIIFTPEVIGRIYDTTTTTKNKSIDELKEKTEKKEDQEEEIHKDDLSTKLMKVLNTFSIQGEIYKKLRSYRVTNYFLMPQVGTKMSRIESIEEELSMAIGRNIRVTSSLQGVILEVANESNDMFSFKDIWEQNPKEELPLFIGFDSLGEKVVIDLTKQPHILMCGTTGSGKSSALQCLIHSLITSKPLNSFKFLFIDPKVLELSVYKNLPNLFCPIVTDMESASKALSGLVEEMENRYKIVSRANQRSIREYNRKIDEKKGEKTEKLPYLICIIEEFADLALYKNNNFKTLVQRLAQMGRAAGIHLIIATQRPSVNVIDGVIKANFPTRIGLKVANKMESRIILDQGGAERMGGPGEMILLDSTGLLRRVVSAYISQDEIAKLMDYMENY